MDCPGQTHRSVGRHWQSRGVYQQLSLGCQTVSLGGRFRLGQGRYLVPGQGQRIRFRDHLLQHPVDIIIIPMAWRAQDVLLEMETVGIECPQVMVEHQGLLVDFLRDQHPYATVDMSSKAAPSGPHYNPQRGTYWSATIANPGQKTSPALS